MNDFRKKYQVQKLTLQELELLEDAVEALIQFRSEEKPDRITKEQRKKNKVLQEEGFRSRAEKILGIKINFDIDTLLLLVTRAKALKEKYEYDDLSIDERERFEQKLLNVLYGEEEKKDNYSPEKADIVDIMEQNIK